MNTEKISISAVPIVQNEHRFYFTTIPVSSLFDYCFVVDRKSDPIKGFQRRLNENRAKDISKYLAENGSIPTNIVLSAQEDSEIEYNSRSKIISYPKKQGSFLVLDGQHRLWGYKMCLDDYEKDLRVPVSIYIGLTRSEEARLFIDINTTQVGVPSALLLDIKQVAEIESTSEQVLRGLFEEVANNEKSPLYKKMSPSKSVVGKISRVTFNKSLINVIRSNIWISTSKKSQFQLLLNYLIAFSKVIDDDTIFIRAAFFESIFEVFEDVIQTSIAKNGNAKIDSIIEILNPLKSIEWQDQSKGTKSTYLHLIRNSLKKNIEISDSMV